MNPIFTSAVVLLDPDGRVLTVRKRGTSRFMLVGGKPEPGEQPRATALRETAEEVGLHLAPDDLTLLGLWQAPAANEPGRDVHSAVFTAHIPAGAIPEPAGEIEELRWLDPTDTLPGDLAPQLQTRILPALAGHPPAWDIGHLPAREDPDSDPIPGRLARLLDRDGRTVAITELRATPADNVDDAPGLREELHRLPH